MALGNQSCIALHLDSVAERDWPASAVVVALDPRYDRVSKFVSDELAASIGSTPFSTVEE